MSASDWVQSIGLIIVALALVTVIALPLFREPKQVTIMINATGPSDNTTYGNYSIVAYKAGCIDMCAHRFYDSYQSAQLCYEQCQKLGD